MKRTSGSFVKSLLRCEVLGASRCGIYGVHRYCRLEFEHARGSSSHSPVLLLLHRGTPRATNQIRRQACGHLRYQVYLAADFCKSRKLLALLTSQQHKATVLVSSPSSLKSLLRPWNLPLVPKVPGEGSAFCVLAFCSLGNRSMDSCTSQPRTRG